MERDEMKGQITLPNGAKIWTEPSTVRRECCPYVLATRGLCRKTQDPCEDVPDVHCEFAKECGNGNE